MDRETLMRRCFKIYEREADYEDIDRIILQFIRFNACVRDFSDIDPRLNVMTIIGQQLYGDTIFRKGHDRLYELREFMMQLTSYMHEPLIVACQVGMFIVANQVFGDGNHRTALFAIRLGLPPELRSYYDKDERLLSELHELMNDQMRQRNDFEKYRNLNPKEKLSYMKTISKDLLNRMVKFVKSIEK